jgi:hypothetical protein
MACQPSVLGTLTSRGEGMLDRVALGHAVKRQGFYAESVVQAIAASAGLSVSREVQEPEDIDFMLKHRRQIGRPRYGRIEIQVKSDSNPTLIEGELRYPLTRKAYHALNGTVGDELDMPRYLVLVTVPGHFSEYCSLNGGWIAFSRLAYWHTLMGCPDLPEGQKSVTVSVPERNLLTPEALVALTCGDWEEAASWMSA